RTEFPNLPRGFETLEDHERLLELNSVVRKAGTADRKERYQTAPQLHADLVLVQASKSVRRLRLSERRLKTAVWVTAALALLIGAGWVAQQRNQAVEVRNLQFRGILSRVQSLRDNARRGIGNHGWRQEAWEGVQRASKLAIKSASRE